VCEYIYISRHVRWAQAAESSIAPSFAQVMMRVGARRPAAACLMALTVAACFLMSTADCMTPKTMIRPRTIYHAFNQHIRDVTHKVDHWKETGFDAVQLSPLQKSKGNEWWARYQVWASR
jgi:hypothetical protein